MVFLGALGASACGRAGSDADAPDASIPAPTPTLASRAHANDVQGFLARAAEIGAKGAPWLGGILARPDGLRASADGFVSTGRAGLGAAEGDLEVSAARRFDEGVGFAVGGLARTAVHLAPRGAAPVEGVLETGRAVWRGAWPSTTAILATGARYAELALVLEDERAPREFTWSLKLPRAVARLHAEPSGELLFLDAKGEGLFRVQAPFLVDANGERRAVGLEHDGERLTLRIDPTGLAYPIVVDPLTDLPVWKQTDASGPNLGYLTALTSSSNETSWTVTKWGGRSATTSSFDAQVRDLGASSGGLSWYWTAWSSMPSATTGRQGLGVAAAMGGYMLANGADATKEYADAWLWAGSAWTSIPSSAPARQDSPLVGLLRGVYIGSILVNGRAFVFVGGRGGGTVHDDAWYFDQATNSIVALPTTGTRPTARYAHGLVAMGNSVYLFGGRTAPGADLADTWRLDLTSQKDAPKYSGVWTPICGAGGKPACGFPARAYSAFSVDVTRNRVVMVGGGTSSTQYGDTWELDPTTAVWSPLCGTAATAPCGGALTPRVGAAMAFVGSRRRGVLVGGTTDGTWEYYVRGNTCTSVDGCDTAYCTDGVCCESVTCGTCQACNVAGAAGACTNVPKGGKDPDTCTSLTSSCNGSGLCTLDKGQPCTADAQCLSGFCTDGICCDRRCNGACNACSVAMGATTNGTCKQVTGSPGKTRCGSLLCSGTSDDCPAGCTKDGDCAADSYCNAAGACVKRKALGATCDLTSDCKGPGCRVCTSGFCVDGVCCESACGGLCQACSAARGASSNGKCEYAKSGIPDRAGGCTDSRTTDPLSCGGNGLCNGSGGCSLYDKSTSCDTGAVCLPGNLASGRFCDGTGICAPSGATVSCDEYVCKTGVGCPSECSVDTDCTDGNYCDDATKKCTPKLAAGGACTDARQCPGSNPYCVDGFCCNQPCDGQCEACTDKGSCIPIVGEPQGGREKCASAPSGEACKAKQCDGIERKSCQGFATSAVICAEAGCEGGLQTAEARCDGKGNCPGASPVSCGSYRCGDTTCKTSCASNADCAAGSQCDASGRCVSLAKCLEDGHTLAAPDGTRSDCGVFRCDASGKCKESCASSDDCTAPNVCDQGKCVPPVTADDSGSGGCAVPSAGGAPGGVAVVGLLAALSALGVARRRR